jgi:hypothetical protein
MNNNINLPIIELQSIYMNNYTNSVYTDINFIYNNICSTDEEILIKMNNMNKNIYQIKINLLSSLLNSSDKIMLKSEDDIIKFFKILSPLNNEFYLGSYNWNIKVVKNEDHYKLFIHNSISKNDSCRYLYDKYIQPIKNKLIKSDVQFKYFEFKSKRFNKTKDIVWMFDITQFIQK